MAIEQLSDYVFANKLKPASVCYAVMLDTAAAAKDFDRIEAELYISVKA
ncbi:MAG: hypothetical protein FWE05_10510 [Defluviitaleaceae bacterium]|nr:hypothetical protein [Defluviitaleaceae bacterium]